MDNTREIINNRYRIIAEIGRGGMGLVYHVQDLLKDNMPFALKIIRQNLIRKHRKTGIHTFKNEYEIMSRLKHPNLTRVYDFGEDKGNYFIIMEYLKGTLLYDHFGENGLFSMDHKIVIISQILRALEYIHSRDMIYVDIKPGNIMMIKDDIKLLDFGLCSSLDQEYDTIRGTLPYMPPETVSGKFSLKTDIFSLGIVFYELVANTNFYDKKNRKLDAIISILKDRDEYERFQEERIKKIRDTEIGKIIGKMISYLPEDRYERCSEIISDINKYSEYNIEYETKETKSSYLLGNEFADRKDDLARLKSYLTGKESMKLLIYSGPSGVGKTRLFMEFKKYCRLNGISFFEGSCMEGEIKNYYTMVEILSQMITDSPVFLLEKFGKYLKLILPDNKRLKDFEAPVIFDNPKVLQDIIIHNITDYILEFANAYNDRFIIYFDDIQWIDEGSELILSNILKRQYPSKLLFYANINENKAEKALDILSCPGVIKYDLHPLDKEGVYEYILNVFGQRFLDISLKNSAEEIKEKVGGNPLFLQELLKSLIEKDIIVKEEGYWKLLKSINDIEIPPNIIDIIKFRLEKLFKDEARKKILNILSLIRIKLDFENIKKIIEKISSIDTAKVILELENLEILQSFIIENTVYYSYNSSIIKDFVRQNITDRKEISLFLAGILESISKGDKEDLLEEIAYHYLAGGDNKNAIMYYEKCGDISKKNYFNEKAVKFYKTAMNLLNKEILEDSIKYIEINLKIAKIMALVGKWDATEDIYLDCINLAKRIDNIKLLAESYMEYGKLHQFRSQHDRSIEYFLKSRKLYKDIEDMDGVSINILNLGSIYYDLGEYDKALEYYEESKGLYEELNDIHGIGLATGNIGNVYYVLGEYHKAIENYEHYQKISKKLDNKKGLSSTTGNIGLVYYEMGQLEKALIYFEQLKLISEEIGDKREIGRSIVNMGLVYYGLRDYKKAMQCFKDYKKISEEMSFKRGIGIATGNLGLVYFDMGNYAEALKCFEFYKKISEDINDKRSIGIAVNNMGLVYHNLGNFQKALEYFQKFQKISEEAGDQKNTGITYSNMGRVYFDLGIYSDAMNCFLKAYNIAENIDDVYGIGDTLASLGDIYFDIADHQKAIEYYKKAIEAFSRLNAEVPALAGCFLELSKVLHLTGNIEEAYHMNDKAEKLAITLNHRNYMIYSEIQCHVLNAEKDKKRSIRILNDMLSDKIDNDQKAIIYYELYKLDKKEEFRINALKIYDSLYREIPKNRYSKRIKELKTL